MPNETSYRHILLTYLIMPLGLLALYCAAFSLILSRFLPQGVNYQFATDTLRLVFFLEVFSLLALIVLGRYAPSARPASTSDSARLRLGDATLLLLPLAPIMQYVLRNREILSLPNALAVVACFVLFSALLTFGIPALMRRFTDFRPLVAVGLAFTFTITSMAMLTSARNWFRAGDLYIQLAIFFAVALPCWLLFSMKDRRVLWAVVTVMFLINTVSQAQARSAQEPAAHDAASKLPALVDARKPVMTPNIYLLIYDSYVPNETMQGYGLDNSAQEEFLRDQGFRLYPRTYSIGATTLATMTRVLAVSNDSSSIMRREVSGDNVVQSLLKSYGYQAYGIFPSDFMFRGIGSSYDLSVPAKKNAPAAIYLIAGVMLGEFRFDLGFDKQKRAEYMEVKQEVFTHLPDKPVFLYSHSNRPGHSQNSGACLADETEQYSQRLEAANEEMRRDVTTILANDPGAIIIIGGDHGPYLTKNCVGTGEDYPLADITRLDIQDRYGTFLAIHWPANDYADYDKIVVLQDIFPAVFAYMFRDPNILNARVDPVVIRQSTISWASIENGVIRGGSDDGQPLFLTGGE